MSKPIDMNIFKRPIETYLVKSNPVKDYIEQSATFISKIKDIPYDDAVLRINT